MWTPHDPREIAIRFATNSFNLMEANLTHIIRRIFGLVERGIGLVERSRLGRSLLSFVEEAFSYSLLMRLVGLLALPIGAVFVLCFVFAAFVIAPVLWRFLFTVSFAVNLLSSPGLNSIAQPPGMRWLAFVDFLFSPKTVDRTFRPIVADWQYEYFEALKGRRLWKSRWISIRYRCLFIWCIGFSRLIALINEIKSTRVE